MTVMFWMMLSMRLAAGSSMSIGPAFAAIPEAMSMAVWQASSMGGPQVADFPGGVVWRAGDRVLSAAKGLAPARHAKAELMAKRAAYLVAVRNAGLYLAGWRSDAQGRLQQGSGTVSADLHVTHFREVSSTYDAKTRTATAVVEVRLNGENASAP